MSWWIRCTYFESCNCDAICPCRRINGMAGGRSTHGVCMRVLSWLVGRGAFGPDRHRPFASAPAAADSRARHRSHPRPCLRRRDRHVCHPGHEARALDHITGAGRRVQATESRPGEWSTPARPRHRGPAPPRPGMVVGAVERGDALLDDVRAGALHPVQQCVDPAPPGEVRPALWMVHRDAPK
jgi:hypothetical protein